MSGEHRRRLQYDARLAQLSRRQRDLLLYLATRAKADGRLVWQLRTGRLAAELLCSPRTIERARHDLIAAGLIAADPLPPGPLRQKGTIYTVAASFDAPLAGRPILPPVPDAAQLAAVITDDDPALAGWCAAARIRGRRHVNRRCCGTTIRQQMAAEQLARRQLAAVAQRTTQADRRAEHDAAAAAAPAAFDAAADAREQARDAIRRSKVAGG